MSDATPRPVEPPRAPDDFYCDEALSGRTSVPKMLETEAVLAFHHTRPFWPVHVVVVPKCHVPSLLSLEAEDLTLLCELITAVQRVAAQILAGARRLPCAHQPGCLPGFQAPPLARGPRRPPAAVAPPNMTRGVGSTAGEIRRAFFSRIRVVTK
jgi:HIT domain